MLKLNKVLTLSVFLSSLQSASAVYKIGDMFEAFEAQNETKMKQLALPALSYLASLDRNLNREEQLFKVDSIFSEEKVNVKWVFTDRYAQGFDDDLRGELCKLKINQNSDVSFEMWLMEVWFAGRAEVKVSSSVLTAEGRDYFNLLNTSDLEIHTLVGTNREIKSLSPSLPVREQQQLTSIKNAQEAGNYIDLNFYFG